VFSGVEACHPAGFSPFSGLDCKLQIENCKLQIELSSLANLKFAFCSLQSAPLRMTANRGVERPLSTPHRTLTYG
jgi:hypothetical protein